jgi:DNA-binding MarR family transcriptional regulator
MPKRKKTSNVIMLSSSEVATSSAHESAERAVESLYGKRIILALRHIMQQMDTHSRRLMKHHDITVAQIVCLYEIYEKGAHTLSLLSKNIHLSTSTLVGIVDRLEEKGLVKRTRDTEDRRAVFIDITGKGREFVESSPHLLHNKLDEKLKSLSESEQVIIANSLDLLVDMLRE